MIGTLSAPPPPDDPLTPAGADRPVDTSPSPSATLRRLDAVYEQLSTAEVAVGELVRRLEPALPTGFGERTSFPVEPRDPMDVASPLALGLADLASRGGVLVRQLRALCDEVDL